MKKIEELQIKDVLCRSSFRQEDLSFILRIFKLEGYGDITLKLNIEDAGMFFNFISRSFRSYIEKYIDYKESVSYHKSEWHKAIDELPKEHSPVLFMTADNDTSILSIYSGYMDENERWISDDGSILYTYGTYVEPIGVLYWRELKTVK